MTTPTADYLRVKVLEDEAAGRVFVVDARHGEQSPAGWVFAPAELCRLTAGPDRSYAEVLRDAHRIACLWNTGHEPSEAFRTAEGMVGTDALASLFFRDLLAAFDFADLPALERFVAFWGKLISPAGHALWDGELKAAARERICALLNAWSHNSHLTLKYARKRHADEAAVAKAVPEAS